MTFLLAHAQELVPPPPGLHALTLWPLDPPVVVSILLAGIAYGWGYRRVPHFPAWRAASFMGGLVVLLVALGGPIAAYDTTLLSLHMAQHLLVTSVAAPLLALGAPVALALRAAAPVWRRRLVRVAHSRVVRVIGNPLFTFGLFAAVMWGSHYSNLYPAALESEPVHAFEHLLYLVAAFLYWWPVVGADPGAHRLPYPGKLVYLFLTMPVQAALGLSIYMSPQLLYAHYGSLLRPWGPSPLEDQRVAGELMWVGGNLLMIAPFVLTIFAWMRHEDRKARRVDRLLDRLAAENGDGNAPPSPETMRSTGRTDS
jgi:putative copper resistance protein D